jgi:Trk K+ transport system NAD-binding subunit
MRVIIVGIGDIGYELTRDLTRSGSHEVVLIDSSEARSVVRTKALSAPCPTRHNI